MKISFATFPLTHDINIIHQLGRRREDRIPHTRLYERGEKVGYTSQSRIFSEAGIYFNKFISHVLSTADSDSAVSIWHHLINFLGR